jgi:DAACS family dicarboxylate/amino acid:cation (Na+ or H+) symporter
MSVDVGSVPRGILTLPLQMVAGLVLGSTAGLLWPAWGESLLPVGALFVEAIKMVVIPLVFSAVTLGVYRMGTDFRQLGRVAAVAITWFFLATVLSILIALGLNGTFRPGLGTGLVPTGSVPTNLALSVDWTKYFLDLIPSNIIAAMAGQKVLPTLIFAVLFGLALAVEHGARVAAFIEDVLAAMFRMTRWIIALSPIAVFAIMAWIFATKGVGLIVALAKLIAVMYLGLAIMVVIFWILLWCLGEKPLVVTRKVLEPVLLGFASRSSEVTLPAHMERLEQLGVSNKISSVVLPLGYSFNLDGSAMYIALAVTFLADAYGIPLTWVTLSTILLTTIIASKGIANVPSGSLVAMATVLTAIGLPVEAIAIIAGVDVFMDMGRTAVNVFGNTAAVLLVQKFNGAKDLVPAEA